MPRYLSWIEGPPPKRNAAGSSPVRGAKNAVISQNYGVFSFKLLWSEISQFLNASMCFWPSCCGGIELFSVYLLMKLGFLLMGRFVASGVCFESSRYPACNRDFNWLANSGFSCNCVSNC